MDFLFTSESVTEGHSDKVADQVSDAILDSILEQDPSARSAVETMIATGMVCVAGEVNTKATVDVPSIVQKTIKEIGYDDPAKGFDYKTCNIFTNLSQQSPDIAQGVDQKEEKEQGAGDQGIMFGYAIREDLEYMPYTISLSHRLAERLTEVRKDATCPFIRPDGKTQVTMKYENNKPSYVDTIVISTQHDEDVRDSTLKEAIHEEVIKKIVPSSLLHASTKYHINPTGRFVIGGPQGDCGLTGRKIIVDTYGGHGSHGGGAFSGKDPSKVDRSASYAARYAAKNIVAAGLAEKCLLQLGYAIGVASPVSIMIQTYGTEKVSLEKIHSAVKEFLPFKPKELIEKLRLLRPIYQKTARYGHFGRRGDSFSWEETDMVDALKSACIS